MIKKLNVIIMYYNYDISIYTMILAKKVSEWPAIRKYWYLNLNNYKTIKLDNLECVYSKVQQEV